MIFSLDKVTNQTRNPQNIFSIPFHKTNMWQKACTYSGPKIWNSLPTELKVAKSQNIFKHKL